MATPIADREAILRAIETWPVEDQVALAQAILRRAGERGSLRHRGAPPSARAVPPLPRPGTPEAAFLDRLNEVYEEDPSPDEVHVVAGISAAFGMFLSATVDSTKRYLLVQFRRATRV